jgi:hypothetical protein
MRDMRSCAKYRAGSTDRGKGVHSSAIACARRISRLPDPSGAVLARNLDAGKLGEAENGRVTSTLMPAASARNCRSRRTT